MIWRGLDVSSLTFISISISTKMLILIEIITKGMLKILSVMTLKDKLYTLQHINHIMMQKISTQNFSRAELITTVDIKYLKETLFFHLGHIRVLHIPIFKLIKWSIFSPLLLGKYYKPSKRWINLIELLIYKSSY